MNLAIHDTRQLTHLHEAGRTEDWPRRRVTAWVTQGQLLGRPGLPELLVAVPLGMLEIQAAEAPFFRIFQERLRGRLSHREAVLLFLAELTGSVVLTTEGMVADTAEGLGLRVCSGSEASLDLFFPLLPQDPAELARPLSRDQPDGSSVTDRARGLSGSLSPEPPPSSWRVPGRD